MSAIEDLARATGAPVAKVERALRNFVHCVCSGEDDARVHGTFAAWLTATDEPLTEFDDETVEHVARQLAAQPDLALDRLELVTPAQRAQLDAFNATRFEAGGEPTVVAMFARAVAQFPDHRAVSCQGASLTYAELDRRTAAFARRLVRARVTPGEPVAIQLPPSIDTIVAMLGVLRAGACYVPLDPELPAERVRYIVEDSGARFVVGTTIDLAGLDAEPTDIALPHVAPSAGAYLIYTSGTTGKPKGVLVEHHSLANYTSWFRQRYNIDSTHTAALLTSYAFDLGYTTLWTTILSGGDLHVLPKLLCEDAAGVARYIREHRVSFIKVTPSLLAALVHSHDLDRDHWGSLRLIVTGGERVRVTDIETIYARLPDVRVINHYGPTETTIGVMTHPIDRARLAELSARPVVGRPIGNTRAYVTTRSLQLLPVGAVGELLVAGEGVARGYHARPELTAEKFVPEPFGGGGRAYRTGDLARWTPEGTLEFLGRIDRQIKVRGYRIEPSEIEQVMIRRLGLREVVVIDRLLGESNRVLCAYHVGAGIGSAAEMRANLLEVLPEYMVPAYLIEVPALPRNANGKLEVSQLPEPTAASVSADPPTTETERVLAKMWADVLGIDVAAISVSQNFFELGGHSLLMIQLIAEIDNHFGRTVDIPVFFQDATIRALAKVLDDR